MVMVLMQLLLWTVKSRQWVSVGPAEACNRCNHKMGIVTIQQA